MRYAVFRSLAQVAYALLLISERKFCLNCRRILGLGLLLKIPVIFTSRLSFLTFSSISTAAVLILFFLAFLLGGFCINSWSLPCIMVGISTLAPVAAEGWKYESVLGLIGFAMGSLAFPLDWPVCWKEPPVAHTFLFVFGGFAGSLLDHFHLPIYY